jgi:hypothetical protein
MMSAGEELVPGKIRGHPVARNPWEMLGILDRRLEVELP